MTSTFDIPSSNADHAPHWFDDEKSLFPRTTVLFKTLDAIVHVRYGLHELLGFTVNRYYVVVVRPPFRHFAYVHALIDVIAHVHNSDLHVATKAHVSFHVEFSLGRNLALLVDNSLTIEASVIDVETIETVSNVFVRILLITFTAVLRYAARASYSYWAFVAVRVRDKNVVGSSGRSRKEYYVTVEFIDVVVVSSSRSNVETPNVFSTLLTSTLMVSGSTDCLNVVVVPSPENVCDVSATS